jgi:hypothetical protein
LISTGASSSTARRLERNRRKGKARIIRSMINLDTKWVIGFP